MKNRRKIFFFVIPAFLAASLAIAGEITIQSCSDGDTCTLQIGGLSFKARLVGIDAPEIVKRGKGGQPFGEESKQFLNERVAGRKLQVTQYGIDGYNRPLVAIEAADKTLINEELVRNGLAEVYEGRTKYDLNRLHQLQSQAKNKQVGIWSLGSRYVSPYRYRKRQRDLSWSDRE